MFDIENIDLKSKSKDELIELVVKCASSHLPEVSNVYSVSALDKLKEYSSLQAHIDKINKNSQNVSVMMFRIFNLGQSNNIFTERASKRILGNISKFLKAKIRSTDILIKYGQQNFVIIAPNTDIEGIDRYAHKLNSIIHLNMFGDISHLKSNFSTTSFKEDDDMKMIFERLDRALLEIEKDLSNYFIQI